MRRLVDGIIAEWETNWASWWWRCPSPLLLLCQLSQSVLWPKHNQCTHLLLQPLFAPPFLLVDVICARYPLRLPRRSQQRSDGTIHIDSVPSSPQLLPLRTELAQTSRLQLVDSCCGEDNRHVASLLRCEFITRRTTYWTRSGSALSRAASGGHFSVLSSLSIVEHKKSPTWVRKGHVFRSPTHSFCVSTPESRDLNFTSENFFHQLCNNNIHWREQNQSVNIQEDKKATVVAHVND